MNDITSFIRARLDEQERVACAATPETWKDAGGTIALAFNGLNEIADYIHEQADINHIVMHQPEAVLRDVEATRAILALVAAYQERRAQHERAAADLAADIAEENRTGRWSGAGLPDVRSMALRREEDMLGSEGATLNRVIRILASRWSTHPDYQQEWTP